jgi:glycosyltransferase involved in cell wall biosynthesis
VQNVEVDQGGLYGRTTCRVSSWARALDSLCPVSAPVPVPRVAAVIPAKDEAERIVATVRAARGVEGVDLVLVVDDGSRDSTARLAEGAGAIVVSHSRSRGKAAAMETGSLTVRAIDARETRAVPRHLLFLDADLEDSASEASALVAPVLDGKADMTIAVLPATAKGGGHGFVVRLSRDGIARATGWRPQAPLSGQRCVTRRALDAARPFAYGFGVETGLTIDLLRKGFRVEEVPVAFHHRVTGSDWRGQVHRGKQWLHVAGALAQRGILPNPRAVLGKGRQ